MNAAEAAVPELPSIGLIGYGEVGTIFGEALRGAGERRLAAWDLHFSDPDRAEERVRASRAGIQVCGSMEALVSMSNLILCAVTASQTLAAAEEAAPHIRAGAFYVDLNSASPATKRTCAAAIGEAGGQYVEAAIMTSVPPHGLKVPMLIGGPWAEEALPVLRGMGMNVEIASAELGVASAIKMCRSVLVKGLEALVVESYLAARSYGVEDAVLASLQETFPGFDWDAEGSYFFERVVRHGRRRAEEMREAAATVGDTGIDAFMSEAVAERQDWLAELGERLDRVREAREWRPRADAALAWLRDRERRSDRSYD